MGPRGPLPIDGAYALGQPVNRLPSVRPSCTSITTCLIFWVVLGVAPRAESVVGKAPFPCAQPATASAPIRAVWLNRCNSIGSPLFLFLMVSPDGKLRTGYFVDRSATGSSAVTGATEVSSAPDRSGSVDDEPRSTAGRSGLWRRHDRWPGRCATEWDSPIIWGPLELMDRSVASRSG